MAEIEYMKQKVCNGAYEQIWMVHLYLLGEKMQRETKTWKERESYDQNPI